MVVSKTSMVSGFLKELSAYLGAAAAMTSAAEHVLVPRVRPCVVACFPAPAHRASNGRSCSWISTFMNKDPSIAAWTPDPIKLRDVYSC